jgi:putative FmdB family regulatory protein
MPVYEYQCDACGKQSEEIQKFSDAPLTDCEACGAKGALKKLISRSSFALKGSGWYTTDYKRAAKPAGSGDASPAPATGDAAASSSASSASKEGATPAAAATPAPTPVAPKKTES